jgi:ketosteroid isomerase-like protein
VLADVIAHGVAYSSFSRTTEHASVHGEVGITIGSEVVLALPNHPSHRDVGKAVHRRYTHVWRKQDGRWQLLLRHVSVNDGEKVSAPTGRPTTRSS